MLAPLTNQLVINCVVLKEKLQKIAKVRNSDEIAVVLSLVLITYIMCLSIFVNKGQYRRSIIVK